MNITTRLVVDSVYQKKYTPFPSIYVNTEKYRFTFVKFLPIFPSLKLKSRNWTPQTWYALNLYCHPCYVRISAFHIQLYFGWFSKSLSRDLESPKLANTTLSFIAMLCSKFNFLDLTIFQYYQTKNFCWRKNKGTT